MVKISKSDRTFFKPRRLGDAHNLLRRSDFATRYLRKRNSHPTCVQRICVKIFIVILPVKNNINNLTQGKWIHLKKLGLGKK